MALQLERQTYSVAEADPLKAGGRVVSDNLYINHHNQSTHLLNIRLSSQSWFGT